MIELLIGSVFLLSLWVFGRSLIVACKMNDYDWCSMSLGLCFMVLVGNALYFVCGFTIQFIQVFFLCLLFMGLYFVFRRGINRSEYYRLFAVLSVFLFLILSAYIGGEQYYVFRGNHFDHFSYIDQALTIWKIPYTVYKHILPEQFRVDDVLVHGVGGINARPAVGLVFAMFLPPRGIGNIHLLAFIYVTALWALVFPAICFAWQQIVAAYELKKNKLLFLIGPPLAYVIGFWGQYIFDINAWSQIVALPILLVFVFVYIKLLQKLMNSFSFTNRSVISDLITTGVLLAGAFIFYPENTVMHVVFIGMATILWCIITGNISKFKPVVLLAIFYSVVLLIASFTHWKGIVEFLFNQFKFGMGQRVGWWSFFDTYFLGIHSDVLFNSILTGRAAHWQECFNLYWIDVGIPKALGYVSIFANMILAPIGMFFITPNYTVSFWMKFSWITAAIILAIMVIYNLFYNLFIRIRDNQAVLFLNLFFLSGVVYLLYLLIDFMLWAFGKGLSFLSPYLFLVFCLGLIKIYEKTKDVFADIRKWFVIIFIILQIVFGMARLWYAGGNDGIGYKTLMYPSIQVPGMKTEYLWNVDVSSYADCKKVEVQVANNIPPFYKEYIKQKFTYLNVPVLFSSINSNAVDRNKKSKLRHSFTNQCLFKIVMRDNKWTAVKK